METDGISSAGTRIWRRWPYRKLAESLLEYGVLLFHGSSVAVDGFGYIFAAQSGTGKSTHARLWRELLGERAVMVNDDKVRCSTRGP